jgi:two-component system, NtrC family, nitrogen regulation sensor histidine kinase NtrY
MRLRPRFALWFSLAALAPIAVAAVVTREVVSQSYTDEFARVRRSAEATLARERTRLETSVTDVLASMKRHPLVDGVFVELQKHGGDLPAETRRDIKDRAGDYLRGLGLDVLILVETDDRILAAPHYRPMQDTVDPAPAARARATGGRAHYVREPMMRNGQVVPVLVVSAARQFPDGRHRLTVVVGQEVGKSLLDTVRQPDRIHARILDPQGNVLVPPAQPWPTGAADVFRIPLPGPGGDGRDGAPTAIIETAISRADLERVLTQVTVASLVLAAGALVVTIVLGMFGARRMTRDLDRLVEGAQAAARGDLDHRVDVRARDEIGAVATSFNLMMEDLKTSKERLVMAERVAAWQEIARRLAHEIKNPLTPIQMAVETLRKTWTKKHPSFDEIFDESTATVLEESARLKRIVSEFSQFARMPKPDLGPCDLNDIVTSCLALYGGSVPVTRRLAQDLPPIHADRDQIQQVLLNLLENARDALGTMPADHAAAIAVETRPGARPDRVELVVADNGPGIAEAIREKLFTPYFTTKQTHGGTGLGLAIAHRILSDHEGRISVRESELGGACFCVELPASTPAP